MVLPVELDPRAEEEARAAFFWYLERSERAAAAFEREIESAVTRIGDAPTTYPIVEGELRRFLLDRFPTPSFTRSVRRMCGWLPSRICTGSRVIGETGEPFFVTAAETDVLLSHLASMAGVDRTATASSGDAVESH